MKYFSFYTTPIGQIGIAENGDGITNLFVAGQVSVDNMKLKETPLLRAAAQQLQQYLAGQRKIFDLPLALAGTAFQQQVWSVLQTIPYGETRSYKQVAETLGNPQASRAVGGANNKNPIMIIVPCHRVVGSSGSLVGYAGGLDLKAKLLQLEK